MKHAAPGKCPVCGHGFKVTELKCDGCGREVMVPRAKAEKSLKKIIRTDGEDNV